MAAYNEGDLLLKTVESVREIAWLLDMEIVVADDCSDDGSIERLLEHAPEVQMVSNPERMGCPPARDLAARCARGDVLVFLDAHTKPEQGAILRLVSAVEEVEGDSISSLASPSSTSSGGRSWSSARAMASLFSCRASMATGSCRMSWFEGGGFTSLLAFAAARLP